MLLFFQKLFIGGKSPGILLLLGFAQYLLSLSALLLAPQIVSLSSLFRFDLMALEEIKRAVFLQGLSFSAFYQTTL
jgi:hypothetical protein